MNIKRYVVKDMHEALVLIKQDLGSEAIIVSSHKVREKGIKGWFRPPRLEVTAVLEQTEIDNMKQEIGQIKQILAQFTGGRNNPAPLQEETAEQPEQIRVLRQKLLDIELDPQVVDILIKGLDPAVMDRDRLQVELLSRLEMFFKPALPRSRETKALAFVGPTGVGKTTTLAKIGAIYSLFNSFNIGFITIDTYRVGAVEQMKIYGEIIGASVDVVMSPEELKKAVDRNSDKDLLLIDTTGRPSHNRYQLGELKAFLDVLESVDVCLVINATTKNQDMLKIINDYKTTAYTQMIITKIDETISPGSIVNAAYYGQLPITYITNGQDVPDDIEEANPTMLAGYVLKELGFSGQSG
jgi:flagellar biosynthesis protein FlhF